MYIIAFTGVLIPAMGGVTFSLNIPTIIALRMARSILKAIQAFLISTLVCGVLMSETMILLGMIAL